MSDEQKGFWGCVGLVVIVLLIGVGLRSQNFDQFLSMGGKILLAVVALSWGLGSLSEDGCLAQLWALFCGLVALTLVISIGTFLVTGDYERSAEIANWAWRSTTPTPAASVQTEATPTATSTPKPTFTPAPTSTPTPTPEAISALVSTPAPTPRSDAPGEYDWSWLAETKEAEVPVERVTEALNEIWGASARDAAEMADKLSADIGMASVEGKRAAGLLIAVALERAEDSSASYTAYEQVKDEAEGTSYAASAAFRLRFLRGPETEESEATEEMNFLERWWYSNLAEPTSDDPEESEATEEMNFLERWWYSNLAAPIPDDPEDVETIYETIADEPEAEGWFLLSDQWVWDTTRRTASQALVDMRADKLSFRFFQFLRLRSPFPAPYAYMFILLAMTLGAKILALPLYIRTAKLAVQLRRLGPRLQTIQRIYSDNPGTMQQRTMALYKAHGVNPWGGCAVSIVDLIFVVWALVALSSFSPQLVLDGATFWWISDVTQYDFGILLVWTAVNLVGAIIARVPQQVGQQLEQQFGQQLGQQPGSATAWTSCSYLIGSAVIVGIAWHWNWPAYAFIFWALLSILGVLISTVLTAIWTAVK